MTHDDGVFECAWKQSFCSCPHCALTGFIEYRYWTGPSGTVWDVLYRCSACYRQWWESNPGLEILGGGD